MNEIKKFEHPEFGGVRVAEVAGEPWFVGKDVATILGYAKPLNALAVHVDKDDSLKQGLTDGMGRIQETIFINESGLYSLILSSKLPTAKQFKRWVTSEVLPSIRKNGMYAKDELLDNPELLLDVVGKLVAERKARVLAEQERNKLIHQKKLYTSSEIAKEIGFKSAKALNKDLHDRKIQYKQNDTWLLYSEYADKGYVSIKQDILDSGKIIYDRRWTGTGRDFILNLYKKNQAAGGMATLLGFLKEE